ncbi:MAG: response regulator [Nannocystaceae bacterium]|nr:response regulator [bacterium]
MILVVDDSATIRHQVRACLQAAGHTVLEAENGAIGLQKAKDYPIDMAIVDVNMPVMNGLEMLANLRGVDGKKSLPVFVLTTESSKELVAQGKKHGATAWIVKPFKADVLAKGVAHVLARAA